MGRTVILCGLIAGTDRILKSSKRRVKEGCRAVRMTSRPQPHDAVNADDGIGATPLTLSTLCDATGINESLVQNLYEEVVNEEPETQTPPSWIERIKHIPSCRCTDSFSDAEEDDNVSLSSIAQPPQLVAVAEAELEAAFAAAEQDQQQKNEPDASSGEELPLLGQQPQTTEAAAVVPPRRRRHVRDVSEDFAAQALQAIHAPDGEGEAAERGKMQFTPVRHQAPLIPPSVPVPERRPAAGATQKPHRRSQSAFAYGSGQKVSAAEYRANILGNLMQQNETTPNAEKTQDGGTTLRDLLAPSESFRMVHMPADGAPQPARIGNHHRTGTWDFASAPSITDPGTTHHRAAFVLLGATDTTSPEPQAKETGTRGHRHRRGHTTIGIESGSAAFPHTDTGGHRHRRGHSLLPDAIMAPLERGLERGMSILPSIPFPQIEIPTSLPSDVDEVKLTIDVTEGPKGEPEDVDILLVVKRSVPFIGYALLVGACLCLSTTGAVLDKQKGVSPR